MKVTGLGVFLRHLREQRSLSLRELGQLAALDHAYIHRLEKGEKASPSAEVIERISRVLKSSPRDTRILQVLAESPGIHPDFVRGAIEDPSVSADEFVVSSSGMAFRSTKRPDVKDLFKRARKFLNEDT